VTRSRRLSPQAMSVLRALLADPSTWRYGYELGQDVRLQAGSLYPILIRLSDRGLLEARWETAPSPGRPPRHLYRLTGAGLELATEVLSASAGDGDTAGSGRGKLRAAW
jgi:PadR family transcriptional regulator PadR